MPHTLTVTAEGEREIVMTRTFDAPRQLVFDAMTKPELLKRWLFGPDGWSVAVCESDLRVGGAFRYVWRHADGRDMGMGGVYRELAPPERVVRTELFDQDWTGGETLATMVLVEHEGRTTVTTTVRYPSREVRDNVLKSGMERGVAASYDRLEPILAARR